jgi:hypothetical protein
MKNFYLFLFALFILVGCSNGKLEYRNICPDMPWNGWVESSDAKAVYLVNKSKSKKITFTIKTISSGSSEVYNKTYTDTYTLNPGEEKFLICSNTVQKSDYSVFVNYRFEIVGELIEN